MTSAVEATSVGLTAVLDGQVTGPVTASGNGDDVDAGSDDVPTSEMRE